MRSGRIFLSSAIAMALLAGALPASSAFAQDIQDEVRPRGGVTTRFYPHVGVQLMRTFYFRFLNSDHHIAIMEVSTDTPSLNEATINFQDDNANDPYAFRIQHQDVTNVSGIFTGNFGPEVCKGSCTLPIARPVGDFVFVLRGFYVQYIGPDHHIQRFGIFEDGNGNITAALRDNDLGNNDNFIVEVQYAYVPRSRFAALGTHFGNNVAGGVDRRQIPAGLSLIRGFDFAYTSSDHHLEEIGVFQPGGGNLDIFFNDNDNNDRFNWAVDWGILN
jgi:hypothetical protein